MDKKIAERDRRIALFNQLMEEQKLDGLVFTSIAQQANQMAVKYATNYPLTTRRDFAWMPKGGMVTLIVPTVGQQFLSLIHIFPETLMLRRVCRRWVNGAQMDNIAGIAAKEY